ncbi:MAG TPA: hypothetical protein VMD98_14290, partial [Bryocella sp.]|nr:hypothetical protein [Bryocella sp.]
MNLSAIGEPLREANRRIDAYLTRFSGATVCGSDPERQALSELECTLKSAGIVIGAFHNGASRANDPEVLRYRNNLVRLHAVLGRMQSDALVLKSALLKRRSHLDLTKQWYCTSLACS